VAENQRKVFGNNMENEIDKLRNEINKLYIFIKEIHDKQEQVNLAQDKFNTAIMDMFKELQKIVNK